MRIIEISSILTHTFLLLTHQCPQYKRLADCSVVLTKQADRKRAKIIAKSHPP